MERSLLGMLYSNPGLPDFSKTQDARRKTQDARRKTQDARRKTQGNHTRRKTQDARQSHKTQDNHTRQSQLTTVGEGGSVKDVGINPHLMQHLDKIKNNFLEERGTRFDRIQFEAWC